MKIQISSRALFALGLVLLVATNIIVLSGVAANRAGEPEARITLTERELQKPYWDSEENSGLTLRLVWRILGDVEGSENYYWGSPSWFNADKLRTLGFTIDQNRHWDDYPNLSKQPVPKEVFIVLENNGERHREAVRREKMALEKEEALLQSNTNDKTLRENVEIAKKVLESERIVNSRFFAIDAGLDARILREKYGDRTRFIIAKGLVKPNYPYNRKEKEVFGYITELSVDSINVPLEYRKMFDGIPEKEQDRRDEFEPPRYEVELAYGSRFEPWILSVRPLATTTSGNSRSAEPGRPAK